MIEQKPFILTPAHHRLLCGTSEMPLGLFHMHMAMAAQLCRPHYADTSINRVKALMKELADNGFVQCDCIPTRQSRSPYIYVLGSNTIKYVRRTLRWDVSNSFRSSKEIGKNYLHIDHALELNDILIAAAMLKRTAPNYELVRFIHERELGLRPYYTDNYSLTPDMFLEFHCFLLGKKYAVPILLEHDRDTEERRQFRRKIRAYITMMKAQAYQSRFKVNSITIAITTFSGDGRRDKLREWTRQELEGESTALAANFLFTAQPQPPDSKHLWLGHCWYTPQSNQPISLLVGG